MWKLIKLEYRKNATQKYVLKAAVILCVSLLLFYAFAFWGLAVDSDTGIVEPDMQGRMADIIVTLTEIVYMVFSASMYASFTVEAYQKKTMHLMFTYPIDRKKVILAQIIAVWVFCFTALLITRSLSFFMLTMAGKFRKADFLLNFNLKDVSFWGAQVFGSAKIATISILTLWSAVRKKSTRFALIAAMLLIVVMEGNIGAASLAGQLWLPIILMSGAVAVTAAELSRITKKDVPDF